MVCMNFNTKWIITIVFIILTILFFVALTYSPFFEWVFARHQNPLSWYIRPLFLIPFCYFAFKHNVAGISFTVFCLFTSMFWFPQPHAVNENVTSFLAFEKTWIYNKWDFKKVLFVLAVPASLYSLGLAFWKRSIWIGLAVIILIASGKISWSIINAGESGKSILFPALVGLVLCTIFILLGVRKLEKRN
jgi:hypothetical protein